MTWGRVGGLRVMELGMPGALRQELTELALKGRKTATAGHLANDYEAHGEALETVGELLALVDDDGTHVATVQVTSIEVVPFDQVTAEFARSEGEGFEGHDDWARAHRRYWTALGAPIEPVTPIVCLSFAVVETTS